MKTLRIKWRYLEVENKTCPRCFETEKEIKKAIKLLREIGNFLRIEVLFEKEVLKLEEFKINSLKSNEMWIEEKLLENWLNASIIPTLCCGVCEDFLCRAVKIEDNIYEVIPHQLIVEAALKAIFEKVGFELNFFKRGSCCSQICCK